MPNPVNPHNLARAADYLDTLADVDAGSHLDVDDIRSTAEALRAGVPPEIRLRDYVRNRANIGGGWTFDLCRSGTWMWCREDFTVYATPWWADDNQIAMSWEGPGNEGDPRGTADVLFPAARTLQTDEDIDHAFRLYVGAVRGYIAGVGL